MKTPEEYDAAFKNWRGTIDKLPFIPEDFELKPITGRGNNRKQLTAIKKLIRVSKPGLRKYANQETMPRVINGLGIAIISTSKGVITDKEARNLNVGGEVI